MGNITEDTLRHYELSQPTGSPDTHARRLRWQALPPQQQAEQEAPLTEAEQQEWDRLTALFQSWQDQRRTLTGDRQ